MEFILIGLILILVLIVLNKDIVVKDRNNNQEFNVTQKIKDVISKINDKLK